jgi:hypothetical protein
MKRILAKPERNWDLFLPKGYLNGRLYYDAKTTSSIYREARAWAYQLSLHRNYGLDSDVERLTSPIEYLNAWTIYKCEIGKRDDKEAKNHFAEHVEMLSRTKFTFSDFRMEWFNRVNALRELSS